MIVYISCFEFVFNERLIIININIGAFWTISWYYYLTFKIEMSFRHRVPLENYKIRFPFHRKNTFFIQSESRNAFRTFNF